MPSLLPSSMAADFRHMRVSSDAIASADSLIPMPLLMSSTDTDSIRYGSSGYKTLVCPSVENTRTHSAVCGLVQYCLQITLLQASHTHTHVHFSTHRRQFNSLCRRTWINNLVPWCQYFPFCMLDVAAYRVPWQCCNQIRKSMILKDNCITQSRFHWFVIIHTR